MYQKYHTDVLVLGSRETGEIDRTVALYTREFGLVWARAAAVRTGHSKMRYALTHYSRSYVSLIRGKSGWRVAGATAGTTAIDKPLAGTRAFARISVLVMRLVAGEEESGYLFNVLAEAHEALMSADEAIAPTIELVCVARVLYALGYISTEEHETGHASSAAADARDPASRRRAPALRRGPIPISLFTHTAYAHEALAEAEREQDAILRSINRALAETHL